MMFGWVGNINCISVFWHYVAYITHLFPLMVQIQVVSTATLHDIPKQGGTGSVRFCREVMATWDWATQHCVVLQAIHVAGLDCTRVKALSGISTSQHSLRRTLFGNGAPQMWIVLQ